MSLPDEEPKEPGAQPVDENKESAEPQHAATPEELGGHIEEDGSFEPDFGDAIDALAKKAGTPRGEDGKFVKAEDKKEEPAAEPAVEPPATAKVEDAVKTDAAPAAPAPDASKDRDADLKELESKLDPHASPKTKNHFQAQAQKIIEARNAADTAAAEAKKAREELEAARKAGVPKEVDEELKQLRDTVRQIDAARDPALVKKYDSRIKSNEERAIAILQEHAFGKDKDGKEIPGVVDALKKAGVTRKNLDDKITALEKAGEHESAEELKDLLRENSRLAKDKEREIGEIKGAYEQRQQQAQAEEAKTIEAANKRMTEEFQSHAKKFDFLAPPPAVAPEDAPAIRKEKEKRISAFNDSVVRLTEAIKKETATPIDAQISARVGILYRDHVVPHYQSQLAASQKEVETLKAQMKAMKGAGSLGDKTGAGKPAAAPKPEADVNASFDDVIDSMAKAAGVR